MWHLSHQISYLSPAGYSPSRGLMRRDIRQCLAGFLAVSLVLALVPVWIVSSYLQFSKEVADREPGGVPAEWSTPIFPDPADVSLREIADTWAIIESRRNASMQQGLSSAHGWSEGRNRRIPRAIDYIERAEKGPHPIRLKYPVVWAGALFSRSGRCC